MAVPKRRQSSSRSGKRRSHDALKPPNVPRSDAGSASGSRSKKFICPHCKQIKRPHTVCHNCGYYRGQQVIAVERA
jgi:large subunit ribosomal protein L32